MYAIVKTGGKQYRVERGQSLLVERLPVEEGKTCSLEPLLVVDGDRLLDRGETGSGPRVEARVVGHERGPKLRVVKFKPKRGYKRRTGHRQQLTRIEITAIEPDARPPRPRRARSKSGTAGGRRGAEGADAGARGQTGTAARGDATTGKREPATTGKRESATTGKREPKTTRRRQPPTTQEEEDGS